MAKLNTYDQSRQQVGEIELPDDVFGVEPKDHLLHLVVRKQLAAKRTGTHAVKHRSEVNGGGKKPWKQKGTGRARQGSSRSPHWRGGGVVFGPMPRSYDFKVNKREMSAALRGALSKRVAAGDVIVLEDISFEQPKTREFAALLARFELSDALFVIGAPDGVVETSARNIPSVRVLPPIGVNVYDVLRRSKLVLTRAAVEGLTARLGGE